ncbi:hypothetical protein [Rhodopirellula bahusiensis]|uniref:hypothetical protein n=1 Tax=Rhodopirellula bahusiensis TaxID=2014065 RepID=UPI001E2F4251|nr:hypothetical protein [Rhodopirellula bahusiensis]
MCTAKWLSGSVTFVAIVMSLVSLGVAEDFSRFRGDDATGVAEVPGQGWGSPIVVGDRVFVSAVVGEEENTPPQGGLYLGEGVRDPAKGVHHWMVHCFDLGSGKEL